MTTPSSFRMGRWCSFLARGRRIAHKDVVEVTSCWSSVGYFNRTGGLIKEVLFVGGVGPCSRCWVGLV